MTRRERLELKREKRLEWAEKREANAVREFARSDALVANIPLGQPILIGHHSERAHRNALDRCHNAMRRGSESLTMAHHHEAKAEGIERQLDGSIFSDDADAIEQLQAKIDEAERLQRAMTAANKIIRQKPKYQSTPEKVVALVAIGFSESRAAALFQPGVCRDIGFPHYRLTNNNANIRRMKGRIAEIKTRQARTEAAEESGGMTIEGTGEWCRVTFAEKPDYSIIKALKAAGFHWGGGSWIGPFAQVIRESKEAG